MIPEPLSEVDLNELECLRDKQVHASLLALGTQLDELYSATSKTAFTACKLGVERWSDAVASGSTPRNHPDAMTHFAARCCKLATDKLCQTTQCTVHPPERF